MPTKTKRRIKPVIEETVIQTQEPHEKTEKQTPAAVELEAKPPEPLAEPQETVEAVDVIRPEPKEKQSLGKIIAIGFVTMLFVAIVSGAFYTYFSGIRSKDTTPVTQGTPEPTQEPVASPVASASPATTLDVSKYTTVVLNGSGKIGEAGKVKDLLVAKKFNVVKVGNAESYNYTDTIIKLAPSTPAGVGELVKAALVPYATKVEELSSTESKADILIVVGSKSS